ncbi:TniQ family protein [Sedimentitalea arenosa]|uniref:TniQ family protein n=1 Tax=Sedimentitalea arenosa TaxID=2798803 RepID=A0A8J7J6Y5_9RHOB|nr:TniQ family protein [Arenibacterium arenosum]MBJ6372485.1 TniQ family protein [Arenibacterium arenosum]
MRTFGILVKSLQTNHNRSLMVPKLLPLRAAPKHRETVPSFLSRMAAMNGLSATDFALDMGFSLKKIVHLEDGALRSLGSCSGLTGTQLEELVSWTGQRSGDVRTTFRYEAFVSRAVRNPIIRGCPVCLREDLEEAEANRAHPLTQMTMRGDWQLRENDLCIEHSHTLVPLWESKPLVGRYDLSSRFPDVLEDIREGKLERPRVNPSPYDRWLDVRLRTGDDETWLADHTLYAATTFCTLLGAELLRLDEGTDLDQGARMRRARTLGFGVARQGEAAIKGALDDLASLADSAKAGPKRAFGHLFIDFSGEHLEKDDFTPFRKLLRDGIVRNWPVAAGESVLGFVQDERQRHSVLTASDETGIGPSLLEKFLVHAGAIGADDDRPIARKTFDARAYADLLAEIPTLVGPIGMQRAMGATKGQLESLAKDGVLAPRIDNPMVKSPWRVSDGVALVAELQEMAIPIESSDESWESIQDARHRSDLGVGTIIAGVRAGHLRLGRRPDLEGYAAFHVEKDEIDRMKAERTMADGGPLITAAAFGRLVGIRTQGWFEKLAGSGHTPATRRPHPKYGGEWVFASESDIEEFRKRFLTSTMMKDEFGLNSRKKLQAALKRFAPNGEDHGPLYLREDVEAFLK